jgi:hypothetical protein
MGASGTDTSNAIKSFFRCFPGTGKMSDAIGESLKGIFEFAAETSGLPASAQSLRVFNSDR